MARSLLRQLAQIRGSHIYDDTLDMQYAEISGIYLEEDLNYLRSQFKVITGKDHWYDAPPAGMVEMNDDIITNAGDITVISGDVVDLQNEDGYIQSFIGKAPGNDLPAYSSTNYVANNDNLETAIGKLDAALDVTAPDKEVEDITSVINAETAHTLPGGLTYTLDTTHHGENMDVYFNGQLLAADGSSEERDYEETSADSIAFHFIIKPNSNLTYIVRQ